MDDGILPDTETSSLIKGRSPVAGRYDKTVDRESAYERLAATTARPAVSQPAPTADHGWWDRAEPVRSPAPRGTSRRSDTVVETAVKSATRSLASSVGREIGRQILRGLLGGRSGR